jgi:hypothetical protein
MHARLRDMNRDGIAVVDGYASNVIWGSDYPHEEGTSEYQLRDDETNMNRLAMRYCFSGLPSEYVPMMVGENGIRAYGLYAAKLQAVANRIGAPTLDDLAQPIDAIPERGGMYAFRTVGPWG